MAYLISVTQKTSEITILKWGNQVSKSRQLPPMVYIELGNITHDFDQKRLVISNNRPALANWFAEGLMGTP